jgi:hypothetical protein
MTRISYKRHRFPPAVIQHAVWLYFRFTLSLRDVEEMLAHRGIDVSYETIRYWTVKFGAKIAANLRRRQLPPSPRWHLDEMVSTIAGERVWIWRAVDDEGEVLDMIVQKRRWSSASIHAAAIEEPACRATGHRHGWTAIVWCRTFSTRPSRSPSPWTIARQQSRRKLASQHSKA